MSDWKESLIKEIAKIKGGKRMPSGSYLSMESTPYPYLRVTDMVNGTINGSDIRFVPIQIEPKIRKYKISKDDIYVTIAGTLGNFGIIPDKFDNSQLTENAAKITEYDQSKFNKYFLKYTFSADFIQRQIKKEIGTGGGVPKLALHRIGNLKIKYPYYPEQCAIAALLTTIDEAIDATEKIVAKRCRVKEGLMQDLFRYGLDEQGNLRSEETHKFKNSELGRIPAVWDLDLLGKTSYLKGRIGWQGLRADEFINEGPFLVTGTDFKKGKIEWNHCYHVDYKRYKISPEIHLRNNDLLITKDGTIGKVALVNNCPTQAVLNSGIFLMRPLNRIYDPVFMYYLLNSEIFSKFLRMQLAGSTINHLYQYVFVKFNYPKPDISEQSRIATMLTAADDAIENEEAVLEKLKAQKRGLMEDLLTAKVRVTKEMIKKYESEGVWNVRQN